MVDYKYTRRHVMAAFGATALCGPAVASADTVKDGVAAIEARIGGRVGVMALEPKSGRLLAHKATERFAMASTFKWALAAMILSDIDEGRYALEDRVPYGADDLVSYSPVTQPLVAEGGAYLETLCRAAVRESDNTAANLLLARIGGPAGFTARLARWGDDVTRLDRWEPALNENAPGDERDTTTPAAMAALMRIVLFGDVLSPGSAELLKGWMIGATTGRNRLRARFPANWTVGDKTGTGMNGAVNDVAFAMAPGRPPIFIACYMDAVSVSRDAAETAHQEIAQLIMTDMLRLG